MSFDIIFLNPDEGLLEPKCYYIDFFFYIRFFSLDYLIFQFFFIYMYII